MSCEIDNLECRYEPRAVLAALALDGSEALYNAILSRQSIDHAMSALGFQPIVEDLASLLRVVSLSARSFPGVQASRVPPLNQAAGKTAQRLAGQRPARSIVPRHRALGLPDPSLYDPAPGHSAAVAKRRMERPEFHPNEITAEYGAFFKSPPRAPKQPPAGLGSPRSPRRPAAKSAAAVRGLATQRAGARRSQPDLSLGPPKGSLLHAPALPSPHRPADPHLAETAQFKGAVAVGEAILEHYGMPRSLPTPYSPPHRAAAPFTLSPVKPPPQAKGSHHGSPGHSQTHVHTQGYLRSMLDAPPPVQERELFVMGLSLSFDGPVTSRPILFRMDGVEDRIQVVLGHS